MCVCVCLFSDKPKMAMNDDAAPIVNPLSIGSTDRNEINALAVRAVDDTIAPQSTTIR